MSQENYFNKLKELPEQVRQFGGLIVITLIIILSFVILSGFCGYGLGFGFGPRILKGNQAWG